MERFKLIPSVYLFTEKDGKILLSRRFQTGFEDGNYSLVAGHVDGEETMREALSREVKEEIGVNINPMDFKHVLTMHRWCGDHERADFFFSADNVKDVKNMEPDKCDDLNWFPLNNLPSNIVPYIKKAIECYLDKINYCEFGWDKSCEK